MYRLSNAHKLTIMRKAFTCKSFGHQIYKILYRVNLHQLHMLVLKHISNEVILDSNVLCLRMKYWILCQHNSALTITVQHSQLNLNSQISHQISKSQCFLACFCSAAMYSALVVDMDTQFCKQDCHDTAHPVNMKTYPNVDLLLSTSPAQSASVQPSTHASLLPKHIHIFLVPLR